MKLFWLKLTFTINSEGRQIFEPKACNSKDIYGISMEHFRKMRMGENTTHSLVFKAFRDRPHIPCHA